MKKSLKILISTVLVLVLMMTVAFAVPGRDIAPGQQKKDYSETEQFNFAFNDMTGYDWAMKSVQNMAAMGKIKGIGNGKFAPASAAKQIEVLIMTLRYLGLDDELDLDVNLLPSFKKLKAQDWMIPYLNLAIENDILTEEEAEDFNPNKPASRSLTAVYIIRALDMVDEAEEMQDDPLSYNDAAAVPTDRIGYVNLITELGLMIGHNNVFQPNKPLSRAEMAVLFARMYDLEYDHKVIISIKNGTDLVRYYLDGQEIAEPTLSKEGYNLNGWYTNENLSNTSKVTFPYIVDGDATFYAEWERKEFTVTFDENGGTTVAAIYADSEEKIEEPDEPTRTGYTFGGWFYDDEDFEDAVDFDKFKVTKDITLYAKWNPIKYTVTFDTKVETTTVAAITADYGTDIDDPLDDAEGFDGWFFDDVEVVFPYTIIKDITLEARWSD